MKGYRFSKDYERLFELVQKQDVIVATPSLFKHYILCRSKKEIFIGNNSKEQFIEQCETCHLEFLDPADTEDLVGVLRECVEEHDSVCGWEIDFIGDETVVTENIVPCKLSIIKAKQLLKKYEVK